MKMSNVLIICLIIFSIVWFFIIFRLLKKGKISVKYSLTWFLMALLILLVGLFPKFMEFIANLFGFTTISNLVIGIILTLLMFITLVLTMIVTNQRTQIKNLTQEISILKKEVNDEK